MKDAQTTLTIYMMMVVAVATTFNAIVPPILAARRDKRLAAGTKQVKDEVAAHRVDEKHALGTINEKLDSNDKKLDATHKIVNAQKTAMMQKVADAQLGFLTLAKAMLADKPENGKLREAVAAAQALYDQSLRDLEVKEQETPG